MPLPILAALAIGAAGGLAASKTTKYARELINNGETTNAPCHRCGSTASHLFHGIDRSNAAEVAAGMALGAIGGATSSLLAKRTFKCARCDTLMYEDGSRTSWNADSALAAFVKYNTDEEKYERLKHLMGKHKALTRKHEAKIRRLQQQLERERELNEQLQAELEQLLYEFERAEAA